MATKKKEEKEEKEMEMEIVNSKTYKTSLNP